MINPNIFVSFDDIKIDTIKKLYVVMNSCGDKSLNVGERQSF